MKSFFAHVRSIVVLTILAFVAAFTASAQSAVPRRVTQKIDETRLATLKGHVRPFLSATVDRGPADDSQQTAPIMLMFSRTPQQQAELDALVEQQHNKNSALFHKWLTPQEFGRRFEPADEDVEAVRKWLGDKGFTVLDVVPSKMYISFKGTVGQVRSAFHADIHRVSIAGEEHMATVNEPQIPAAIATVVGGINKLDDFGPKPLVQNYGPVKRDKKTGKVTPVDGAKMAPNFTFLCQDSANCGTGTQYELGPQDFYTVYNETPLLTAATPINGAGQTIAVIEEVEVNSADVNTFRSLFGLPAYPGTPNATAGGVNYYYGASGGLGGYTSCTVPGTTTNDTAEESEADLDLQWAGTVAPNAIIDFVACGPLTGSLGSIGIDHSAQYIANYLYSTVGAASMSYGQCEASMTSTNMTYYNNQWELFATEGITAIISSGDGGAEQCYQNGKEATGATTPPSVNGMGSSAYNVSAGGTDFSDAYVSDNYATTPATAWWNATNATGESSAVTYVPETTWAGYCSSILFDSLLQKEASTVLGTNYTPWGVCNNRASVSGGYTAVVGGAGGVSTYSAIPAWQSGVYGVGLNNTSSAFRNIPDISLFASNGFWSHALPYCESDAEACTQTEYEDGYMAAGGTSFVAPQLAGFMALVNQKAGDRQGQADYTFYNLAAQEYGTPGHASSSIAACSGSAISTGVRPPSSCFFNDISNDTPSLQGGTITAGIYQPCYSTADDCYWSTNTKSTGNTHIYGVNSAPGSASNTYNLAFNAGPGYDAATGLGSLNIAGVVNGWLTSGSTFGTNTVLTSSAATVAYGNSITLTAKVVNSGKGGQTQPSGTVQFYDGSTSGTLLGSGALTSACTGSGLTLYCSGTVSASVAASALTPGSNSVIAYFEGDVTNDGPSTSAVVTVASTNWPQTITFAAPATGVYGGSTTLSATGGASGNPVTFAVTSGPGSITGGVLNYTGVGTIVVTASQAGNAAYAAATPVAQSIQIAPASLTIIENPASGTYGSPLPALTGSVSGAVNGDTVGSTLTVTYSTTASSTAPYSNAGQYPITATVSGASAGNYAVTDTGSTLTINPVGLTITVNSASETYGSALPTFTSTLGGLVNGDASSDASHIVHPQSRARRNTLTVDDLAINYSTTASSTSPYSGVGAYSISATLSGAAAGNYTVTSVTPGTLTINPASLTISENPATGIYGSPLPTLSGSVSGAVNGDAVGTTLTVTYSTTASSTAPYSDAGAYPITATVTGASATNYAVSDAGGTLTINPASLTIAVNSTSETYGSPLPTFTSTLGGLVNGDTSTDAKHIVHRLNRKAGRQEVGGTAGDLTVSYTTTASATSPYSNVGAYPINATLTGAGAGNYVVTGTSPGTLTINPASLTINESPATGTYGSPLPTLSGSVSGAVNGDAVGTTLTVTYSTTASSTAPYSDAGAYPITATVTGAAAANYAVVDAGGALTINPASLTISVNSTSETYGSPLPTFTSTLGGLVNGDTSTDAKHIVHRLNRKAGRQEAGGMAGDLTISYTTTASAISPYSNVGTYPINATLTGAGAGNYVVTGTTPGTLTINPAPLEITENPAVGTYGSPLPTFTGSVSGNVNGDTIGTTLAVTYTSDASPTSPYSDAGFYTITGNVTGASSGNYTVTDDGAQLTIVAAQLSIAVDSFSETYGSPLPTFTSTLTGLVNGDTSTDARHIVHRMRRGKRNDVTIGDITIDYSTTASSTSPYSGVGSYAITATLDGVGAGNYTVASNAPGTLTINPASLSISETPATGIYGSALPTLSGTVSGAVNGDAVGTTLQVAYSTTASSTSPYSDAGSYPITATVTGAAAANYTVVDAGGTLTINPAGLTIAVNSVSDAYGSPLPTFTSSLVGLVNGDVSTDGKHIVHRLSRGKRNIVTAGDITIDYSTPASSTSPYSAAGSYPINAVLDGPGAGNYTVTSNTPGTLTINPGQLLVTAANVGNLAYDAPIPTLQYSITGFVNGDTASAVAGSPAISTTATQGSAPGSYPITASLGSLTAASYTFTFQPGTLTIAGYVPATLASPAPGSTLSGPSATFSWAAAQGAQAYQLWVGTSGINSQNVASSGVIAGTSVTVNTLPTTGGPLYVRLYTEFNGTWLHADYTYTQASLAPAAITAPAPGSTLTGPSATFTWSPASNAQGYQLWIGTTGPNSQNIASSGVITGTSVTVNTLPTTGVTLYVRLYYEVGGVWSHADYTYTAATYTTAAITAPAPGSTLTGPSATFTWTPSTNAQGYQLWVGTTGINSQNIASSGVVTGTSVTVNTLPTSGVTLYVRLYYEVGGVWSHADYTYTAATYTQAAITAPAPGSTLTGPSATFTWTPATAAQGYQVWIGTTGVNSQNVYSSGVLTGTSATVTTLPTAGATLYVRLYYEIGGVWNHADYTYTEATLAPAAVTSPTPGSTLAGSSATFTWSPASNAQGYQLWVGTNGVNTQNIASSGVITGTTLTVANKIPTTGGTLYVRLYWEVGGVWNHADYTYTEASH